VLDVISRDHQQRMAILAAVVMDDHVHVLCRILNGYDGRKLLHSWKSVSSHELCCNARTAPVWQTEYHLRWMNSRQEIEICAAYVHANPVRRWPGIVAYPWMI